MPNGTMTRDHAGGQPSDARQSTSGRTVQWFLVAAAISLITLSVATLIAVLNDRDRPRPAAPLVAAGSTPHRNTAVPGNGGIAHNQLLDLDPYKEVSDVVKGIAFPGDDQRTCGFFTAAGRQQFARDFGEPTCEATIEALRTKVKSANSYYESFPPTAGAEMPKLKAEYQGATYTINSCSTTQLSDGITGGPALGTFVLTKEGLNGQWPITGHRKGPATCH